MRVVLTGGGTGGHIYPALSVARCLQGDEILYVGAAEGPEASIVPAAGIEFRSVPSRKLSRKPSPGAVVSLAVSAWGVVKAMGLLKSWRPDVVLGTGGFASAGIMFAAAMLRIPTVVHEANVAPGRVNLLLSRVCDCVALTYEASKAHFPAGKTVVTGLPVRPDVVNGDAARARAEFNLNDTDPLLVVSGGSGGAQTLNRAVLDALPKLAGMGVQIVHQTGKTQFAGVMSEVVKPPAFYHPTDYVNDMPALLAAATLILCRGGSSSLAEVTAAGVPAIVVPYPFAVADHQTHNARALEESGAAILVKDAEFDGERLLNEVGALLGDGTRLDRMRSASRSQGRPEAARRVAELLADVAQRRSRKAPAAA